MSRFMFEEVTLRVALAALALCISMARQVGYSGARLSASAPAEIKLQYNAKLAAIGFPSPLLRGSVHGQSAWFIIDTGAGVHTLASWFIAAADLVSQRTSATTTGSTGVESAVRAVYNAAIRVG